MATNSYKELAHQQVPNSNTTLFTVAGGTQVIIKHINVVNPTVAACWFTLYTTGSTDSDLLVYRTSLDADGGRGEFTGTMTLDAGDTMVIIGETNNALTVVVHGDVVS